MPRSWIVLSRFFAPALALFALSLPQGAMANSYFVEPLPKVLDEAYRSLVNLHEWKFQIDPLDQGVASGWMNPSFDASAWPTLTADRRWEDQGFPNYDGVGWYRYSIQIPRDWQGSKIVIQSEGVDDEYDLYVNGRFVRHFGGRGDHSVWGSPTQAEIDPHLKYGKMNVIALRVRDNGLGGGVWRAIRLRRVPPFAKYQNLLPSPVFDSRPEWIRLYWAAWEMAWGKVSFGTDENGFVPAYMDEGYNEHIYQWDTIFMTLFGRYGGKLFPAMASLDNFYVKQDPNGFIERIYSETDGRKLQEPTRESPLTNPSLFAWTEWEFYRLTGDSSRFARVLPVLEKYDEWQEEHQSSPFVKGLYFSTGFDSGMDNMPRPNAEMAGWVDISLQQALAAKYMSMMAAQLGEKSKQVYWDGEYAKRRDRINQLAWNETDGIYYDVNRDGRHTGVRHIGAFWALLSRVADSKQAGRLIGHLKDPAEFYRWHLFPALAASDPSYSPTASYWQGGVWAPTNYMTIRGLIAYGHEAFAREAALNHLDRLTSVFQSQVDARHVDPNEADGDCATVWECYNADQNKPCTRADAYYYGRQDFVGWTGLGPVALLIEQAIGLEIIGAENLVIWRLNEPGRVGLKDFALTNSNMVSLIAESASMGKRRIKSKAETPFRLQIISGTNVKEFQIPSGARDFDFIDQ